MPTKEEITVQIASVGDSIRTLKEAKSPSDQILAKVAELKVKVPVQHDAALHTLLFHGPFFEVTFEFKTLSFHLLLSYFCPVV
jgi:hypothetical protein